MNDYACILIWDAHTRMGHNIGPYAYGISHTRMGRPIRVWANIRYGAEHGYLYHMRIAIATITVYKQHIAIANTVLLIILDHEFYPRCSFLQ